MALRFGPTGSTRPRSDVARLTPLPSAAWPKVMFMGVMVGGRQAVFALGAGVRATGPGRCRPDHAQCSAITLAAGQSERIIVTTAGGEQRRLSLALTHIARRVTHSRGDALAAYRRHSSAGLCELDLADPVAYDSATGALSAVAMAACRAHPAAEPFPGPHPS